MKKQIITAWLLLFVILTNAQEPPKPPSIEERLKKTNELLLKEVQLNDGQLNQVETVFKNFFEAMDKLRKDNPPPPPPPPDPKVKEAMDKLVKERDEKIKQVLTEDQFKKFKEAEKKLHPPKPGEEKRPGEPAKPQL